MKKKVEDQISLSSFELKTSKLASQGMLLDLLVCV